MDSAQVQVFLGTAILIVLACGMAAIMRWCRLSGGALVGGALAGVLLGPTILGAVRPDLHEQWFIGGAEERVVVDALRQLQGAERAATDHAGLGEAAVEQLLERQAEAIEAAIGPWQIAQRWDRRPLTVIVLALAGLIILAAAAQPAPVGQRPQAAAVMSIGGWAAAVPGAATFIVLRQLGFEETDAAVAAMATAVGPLLIPGRDQRVVETAEPNSGRLMLYAGRVSSMWAVLFGVGAMLWFGGLSRGSVGPWLVIPGLVGVAGLGVGVRRLVPGVSRPLKASMEYVLIPAVTATACTRVDLFTHVSLWPFVLALLVSGDGRWLGAMLGGMVTGGRRLRMAFSIAIAAMPGGTAQIVVVGVAVACDVLSQELAAALVAGAVFVGAMARVRGKVGAQMAEGGD